MTKTERTEKTLSNLYSGLGYEYYTASLLWMMGYEAYKMDADFGFDIMAYNQKGRSFNNDKLSKPLLFQVKHRKIYEFEHQDSSAGNRLLSEQQFKFNKDDFMRLLAEEHSYIVCYFVDATGKEENIVGSFWLNNEQIKTLWNGDTPNSGARWTWFKEIDNKIVLTASIQTAAESKSTVTSLVDGLSKQISELSETIIPNTAKDAIKVSTSLCNKLSAWIARSELKNQNSKTNMYLYAENSQSTISNRILSSCQTEFRNFTETVDRMPVKNY